jgi:hypothetical protein
MDYKEIEAQQRKDMEQLFHACVQDVGGIVALLLESGFSDVSERLANAAMGFVLAGKAPKASQIRDAASAAISGANRGGGR